MTRKLTACALTLAFVFTAVGCGSSSDGEGERYGADTTDAAAEEPSGDASGQEFPDIVEAVASEADGTWTFDVTVSSPYDTPERYADGWRVLDPDGEVLGEHELGHDHAAEQPFTRTQQGVDIPDDIAEVTIEGRDQANGYGGDTVTVDLEAARAS